MTTASADKRLATLRAELALVGFTLVRSTDDRGAPLFIVTKWERTRLLATVDAVAAFARQVAPPAHRGGP